MNTAQVAAIATHLNVSPNQVKRAEEWVSVLFVVVNGLGARFVSKKVIKMECPTLEGSEKQVAWAEDIRAGFQECVDWIERCKTYGEIGSRDYFESVAVRMLAAHILRQASAKWWIDNRNNLNVHSFKGCYKTMLLAELPEWAVKEAIVNSQWEPKRGEFQRILAAA